MQSPASRRFPVAEPSRPPGSTNASQTLQTSLNGITLRSPADDIHKRKGISKARLKAYVKCQVVDSFSGSVPADQPRISSHVLGLVASVIIATGFCIQRLWFMGQIWRKRNLVRGLFLHVPGSSARRYLDVTSSIPALLSWRCGLVLLHYHTGPDSALARRSAGDVQNRACSIACSKPRAARTPALPRFRKLLEWELPSLHAPAPNSAKRSPREFHHHLKCIPELSNFCISHPKQIRRLCLTP
jgi:hypothetical protein